MDRYLAAKSVIRRLPRWLLFAVIVLIAQLVLSAGLGFQPRDLIPTVLGILLIGLLIRGSRIAWVAIVLGTLFQIGSSIHDAQWRLVTGTAIALGLFAPSSMQYVWRARAQQSPRWMGQHALELYTRIKASAYAMAYRLVGWEGDNDLERSMRQRSYRVGLWRFGIASLVLLFLGGVTVNWQESTGGDSSILDVVENIIWICYVFVQLTFIALVALAAREFTSRIRLHGRQQGTKR
jgi:hypothetical protein